MPARPPRPQARLARALLLLGAASPAACSGAQPALAPPPVVDIAVPAPVATAQPDEDEAPVAEDGMIWIPGAGFLMGSTACDTDERPEHMVSVTGFYMDATEVTVEAYDRCLRAGRCEAEERPEREDPEDDEARCNAGHPDRADHPMNCVTWSQAERYCRANGKRLPTEQEWELAARGAAGRMFPWGEAWEPDRLCWNRKDGTCPAGAYRAGDTALGLTDMAGNVWEWTSSRYCPYDEAECSDAGYVDRGGGWISEDPRLLHSAHRGRGEPETWASYLGFRCVKGR